MSDVPDRWPNDQYATFTAWASAVDRETFRNRTLGDAVRWLRGSGFACACCGPPNCCIGLSEHAKQIHRAAHIAARQVLDLAARMAKETP